MRKEIKAEDTVALFAKFLFTHPKELEPGLCMLILSLYMEFTNTLASDDNIN